MDSAPADTKARYIKVEVTGNSEYATNKLAVANLYEMIIHGRKEAKDLSIQSITLNAESLRMDIGGTRTLTASLLPADTIDRKIRWESSKKDMAVVTDGVIEAVGNGKARITVGSSANEKVSVSCEVTVRRDSIVSTGKSTYYSSEEGVSATGEDTNLAEHVNDGDLTTRWTADTNKSTLAKYPEWIAVDLESRVIKGDDGLLNPQGTTSRAACATIIQRFMEANKELY